jgi:glycine/D-amino acid oxidase-like deaminating enzyme
VERCVIFVASWAGSHEACGDAEIKRTYSMARSFGFELHLVSAEEAVKLCPIISPDSVFALPDPGLALSTVGYDVESAVRCGVDPERRVH